MSHLVDSAFGVIIEVKSCLVFHDSGEVLKADHKQIERESYKLTRLSPFSPLNRPCIAPFILREKDTVDTHCMIQLTNLCGNLSCRSIDSRKFQSTESKAFLRSTFKQTALGRGGSFSLVLSKQGFSKVKHGQKNDRGRTPIGRLDT